MPAEWPAVTWTLSGICLPNPLPINKTVYNHRPQGSGSALSARGGAWACSAPEGRGLSLLYTPPRGAGPGSVLSPRRGAGAQACPHTGRWEHPGDSQLAHSSRQNARALSVEMWKGEARSPSPSGWGEISDWFSGKYLSCTYQVPGNVGGQRPLSLWPRTDTDHIQARNLI